MTDIISSIEAKPVPRRLNPDQTAFDGYETNIFEKPDMQRAIFNEMRLVKISKIGLNFDPDKTWIEV